MVEEVDYSTHFARQSGKDYAVTTRAIGDAARDTDDSILISLGQLLEVTDEHAELKLDNNQLFVRATSSEISDAPSTWLKFYKARLCIAKGDLDQAAQLLGQLDAARGLTVRLKFYVLTEQAEIETQRGNVDEAILICIRAHDEAVRINEDFLIATASYNLATNHKRLGEFHKALAYAKQSEQRFESDGASYQLGLTLLDKGNTEIYLGRFETANASLQKAIEHFRKCSKVRYSVAVHRYGWLKRLEGDFAKALESHDEAVENLKTCEQPLLLAKATHSRANVLRDMGDHRRAREDDEAAMKSFNNLQASRHSAISGKDAAWSTLRQEGKDAALQQLSEAIEILSNQNDRFAEGDARRLLGHIHLLSGDIDTGRSEIRRAKEIAEKVESQNLGWAVLIEQAILCFLDADVAGANSLLKTVETSIPDSVSAIDRARFFVLAAFLAILRQSKNKDSWVSLAARHSYLGHAFLEFVATLIHLCRKTFEVATVELQDRLLRPVLENSPEEYVDVWSPDRVYCGVATKSDAHVMGLLHQSVHCWVLLNTPDGYKAAFQRRGDVEHYSGHLDISAAGHCRAGESPTLAVLREIDEELGIKVDASRLTPRETQLYSGHLPSDGFDREERHIFFLVYKDESEFQPRLRGNEVTEVIPIRPQDVIELLSQSPSMSSGGVATSAIRKEDFVPNAHEYLRGVMASLNSFISDMA